MAQQVTDQEYFASLPPNGLDLAEQNLQEYLAEAEQDGVKPMRDVVIDLFLIQQVRQEVVS
jgi:hypothetical protein